MKPTYRYLLLLVLGTIPFLLCQSHPPEATPIKRIGHIVVIYLENRSFDSLFRGFPGADTSASASFSPQIQIDGKPYGMLPPVILNEKGSSHQPADSRFPANLPNAPFLMDAYASNDDIIPDMVHRFYQNQWQINGGRNDRFVAHTDAGALPMGYSDASKLNLWKYAKAYTLCDHFFMAAFGGSFLNHHWLVAAATPKYPNAPAEIVIKNERNPAAFVDGIVTSDGYAVNTAHPIYPTPLKAGHPKILPIQTHPTIGDRLTAAGVSWKWYAGGWNAAMKDPARAAQPDIKFHFHHQPFAYFKTCMKGTSCYANHLKDREDLLKDIENNALPAVSFYKPDGVHDGHPGEGSMKVADDETALIVESIMNSPAWDDTVIIITWDENGGQWDHAAPPVIDRWGPGTRVAAILVSPLVKKGFVDHTYYDTTSILALIEARFKLRPLSARDAAAGTMLNAFEF